MITGHCRPQMESVNKQSTILSKGFERAIGGGGGGEVKKFNEIMNHTCCPHMTVYVDPSPKYVKPHSGPFWYEIIVKAGMKI